MDVGSWVVCRCSPRPRPIQERDRRQCAPFTIADIELVHGVAHDPRTARLVRHIIEFGNEEGILTIAEGIETETQRSTMTEMGCPLLQGFHLARPRPAAELSSFVPKLPHIADGEGANDEVGELPLLKVRLSIAISNGCLEPVLLGQAGG